MSSVHHCPHIAIIESPGSDDVKIGRAEGKALGEALRLAEIEHNYYSAANIAGFDDCLAKIAHDSRTTIKNGVPLFRMLFLHLSMHGNERGVGLTDGEFISWSELGDKLLQVASNSRMSRLHSNRLYVFMLWPSRRKYGRWQTAIAVLRHRWSEKKRRLVRFIGSVFRLL